MEKLIEDCPYHSGENCTLCKGTGKILTEAGEQVAEAAKLSWIQAGRTMLR